MSTLNFNCPYLTASGTVCGQPLDLGDFRQSCGHIIAPHPREKPPICEACGLTISVKPDIKVYRRTCDSRMGYVNQECLNQVGTNLPVCLRCSSSTCFKLQSNDQDILNGLLSIRVCCPFNECRWISSLGNLLKHALAEHDSFPVHDYDAAATPTLAPTKSAFHALKKKDKEPACFIPGQHSPEAEVNCPFKVKGNFISDEVKRIISTPSLRRRPLPLPQFLPVVSGRNVLETTLREYLFKVITELNNHPDEEVCLKVLCNTELYKFPKQVIPYKPAHIFFNLPKIFRCVDLNSPNVRISLNLDTPVYEILNILMSECIVPTETKMTALVAPLPLPLPLATPAPSPRSDVSSGDGIAKPEGMAITGMTNALSLAILTLMNQYSNKYRGVILAHWKKTTELIEANEFGSCLLELREILKYMTAGFLFLMTGQCHESDHKNNISFMLKRAKAFFPEPDCINSFYSIQKGISIASVDPSGPREFLIILNSLYQTCYVINQEFFHSAGYHAKMCENDACWESYVADCEFAHTTDQIRLTHAEMVLIRETDRPCVSTPESDFFVVGRNTSKEVTPTSKTGVSNYKTVLCKYFASGNCSKGDSCTFRHDEPSPAPPLHPNYKTVLCKYYAAGGCSRGDACTFLHEEEGGEGGEGGPAPARSSLSPCLSSASSSAEEEDAGMSDPTATSDFPPLGDAESTVKFNRLRSHLMDNKFDQAEKIVRKYPPVMSLYRAERNMILTACKSTAFTLEAVQWLVSHGADVNSVTKDEYEMTPLMTAVRFGRDELIKYLMSLPQVDEDITSGQGKTARQMAEESGDADILAHFTVSD